MSGDIGCYTLGASAPLGMMDTCVCMGASVSSLHGYNKVLGEKSEKKSVAVIGDSTFIHSGITGLIDIAYNNSNSVVVVLDNSITGMTGHQENPTTGKILRRPGVGCFPGALCKAVGIDRVRVCDPYDLKETQKAVNEELAADGPSVIISRRPCALLKTVKHNPPLAVDTDKCIGCKACMAIGCPAISQRDGKAVIDRTVRGMRRVRGPVPEAGYCEQGGESMSEVKSVLDRGRWRPGNIACQPAAGQRYGGCGPRREGLRGSRHEPAGRLGGNLCPVRGKVTPGD